MKTTSMVSGYRSLLVLVLVCMGLCAAGRARADLLGYWPLDEAPGGVTPNLAGGTVGTLNGSTGIVSDVDRGDVLNLPGTSGDYVAAGNLPTLDPTTDFTWSFWAKHLQVDPPGDPNDVVLGNRKPDAGWIKFTPTSFEFRNHPNEAVPFDDSVDIPDYAQAQGWVHHAVVKSGSLMTYYRNGFAQASGTATGTVATAPLQFGGDAAAGENWQGLMDDVATWSDDLPASSILGLANGIYSPQGAPVYLPGIMSDQFDGTSVDLAKWNIINKGLESTADGNYNAPSVANGELTLGGATTHDHWAGKTLESVDAFSVPAGGELRFDVDRVSLTGTQKPYRSSLWMFSADSGDYVHLSQDMDEGGWSYNDPGTPTGRGVNLGRFDNIDTDAGRHKMAMANDGQFVKMFIDGRWAGSTPAPSADNMRMMLTGQAWGMPGTVEAKFDNAAVSTRQLAYIYDDFNSGSIDPAKWEVIEKGLESTGLGPNPTIAAAIDNGELVIHGETDNPTSSNPTAGYWAGLTLKTTSTWTLDQKESAFGVERDALEAQAGIVRSSIWLWADDQNWIHFSQNVGENGWQYNYLDADVGQASGGGVDIGSLNPLDGDLGRHEMRLATRPLPDGRVAIDMYLDDILGATQEFGTAFAGLDFHLMITGQTRATGDVVFAAFDNVTVVPEPSSLVLLGMGLLGLLVLRRKR